jgi:hypothetical protein
MSLSRQIVTQNETKATKIAPGDRDPTTTYTMILPTLKELSQDRNVVLAFEQKLLSSGRILLHNKLAKAS